MDEENDWKTFIDVGNRGLTTTIDLKVSRKFPQLQRRCGGSRKGE